MVAGPGRIALAAAFVVLLACLDPTEAKKKKKKKKSGETSITYGGVDDGSDSCS